MMDGYRRLGMDETICKGDILHYKRCFEPAMGCIGDKPLKGVVWLRHIPPKKKVQRRINVHDVIVGILADQYHKPNPYMAYYYDQCAKKIKLFYSNNYRRRKK